MNKSLPHPGGRALIGTWLRQAKSIARNTRQTLLMPITFPQRRFFLLLAVGLFVPTARLWADEPAEAIAKLIEQAKQETGKIEVFGKPLNPQQNEEMSRRISAFYRTTIVTDFFSALHAEKAGSVIQNVKLGVNSGIDVFWTGATIAQLLKQNDVVAGPEWVKALGLSPTLAMSDNGVRIDDETLASVMYNTSVLEPVQVPKTYADLQKDKSLAHRIALPRTAATFIYISYGIGEDATISLARALMGPQQATLFPTYPDVRARVLSGEFAIGIGTDGIMAKRTGAPAGLAPIDPMVVVPTGAWLMKDAQHPAGGKLVVYWLTTPDGQKALNDILGISLVTTPGTELSKQAEGKTPKIVSYDYVVSAASKMLPVYNQILGIR